MGMRSTLVSRDARICALVAGGISDAAIGLIVGLTELRVGQIRRRDGAMRPNPPAPATKPAASLGRDERDVDIAAMIRIGVPTRVIAAKYGISPSRARAIAKANGVRPVVAAIDPARDAARRAREMRAAYHTHSSRAAATRERVRTASSPDLTARDVASAAGVSHATAVYYLAELRREGEIPPSRRKGRAEKGPRR